MASFPRRVVQISYRDAPIDIRIGSVGEECDIRVVALLKARGVECGLLKRFWVESDLLEAAKNAGGNKKTVVKSLVSAMAVPRQRASALFEEQGEVDSSQVAQLLGQKESWMLSMDMSFLVEIAFLTSMLGTGGESILQRRIMKATSDTSASTHSFTPQGAQQKLAALSDSKLAKFCSKSAQGQLQACRELLACLVQGRAPGVERAIASGGFLMPFIGLMGNFCRHQPKRVGDKPMPVMIFGREACHAKYDLVNSAASLKKMTLKEIEPLHIYQWLLTPPQRADVEKWTTELLGSARGQKHAAPPQAAESAASGWATNRAKRTKTAASNEDVNSLFS